MATVQVNPIAINQFNWDFAIHFAYYNGMALHEALSHCCQQDRYMDLPSKSTSSIQFLPQVPIFSLAVRLLILIYSGGGMAAEEESFFTLHKNLDLYMFFL
ncbi:hypothetical protein ACJX0J_037949 [Zea mays]